MLRFGLDFLFLLHPFQHIIIIIADSGCRLRGALFLRGRITEKIHIDCLLLHRGLGDRWLLDHFLGTMGGTRGLGVGLGLLRGGVLFGRLVLLIRGKPCEKIVILLESGVVVY